MKSNRLRTVSNPIHCMSQNWSLLETRVNTVCNFFLTPFFPISLLIPLKTSENIFFPMFSGRSRENIGKKRVKFTDWLLCWLLVLHNSNSDWVKSVQIRSFFWSIFSCIPTEYWDLRGKSPYSVLIQENENEKELRIWKLFKQCLILIKRINHLPLSTTTNIFKLIRTITY